MTTPNPNVPNPNAYSDLSAQQLSYQYQGGVPPQALPQPGIQANWAAQPGNGAAVQGYPQAGYAGYGHAPMGPMAPMKRRTSYMAAGTVFGIGILLVLSPFIAWFLIEFIPGNHGDGGDGLYWLPIAMIFYILPIGLIVIVASIIVAIVTALKNRSS